MNAPTHLTATWWLVAFAALTVCAPATSLGSITFRPECVGKLEFSLPTPVEVSAYRSTRLRSELLQGSNQQWFEFADGTDASRGRLDFFGNGYISHPLKEAEFTALLDEAKNWRGRARKLAADQAKRVGTREGGAVFSDIAVAGREGVAWRFDNSIAPSCASATARCCGRSTSNQRQRQQLSLWRHS